MTSTPTPSAATPDRVVAITSPPQSYGVTHANSLTLSTANQTYEEKEPTTMTGPSASPYADITTEFVTDMHALLDDWQAFDAECEADEHTDTSMVWDLMRPMLDKYRPPPPPPPPPDPYWRTFYATQHHRDDNDGYHVTEFQWPVDLQQPVRLRILRDNEVLGSWAPDEMSTIISLYLSRLAKQPAPVHAPPRQPMKDPSP